jgi:hypothetical protein
MPPAVEPTLWPTPLKGGKKVMGCRQPHRRRYESMAVIFPPLYRPGLRLPYTVQGQLNFLDGPA